MSRISVLTEREKATIRYAVAFNVTDWELLYRISREGEYNDSRKVDPAMISRWKHLKKIEDFYNDETQRYKMKLDSLCKAYHAEHYQEEDQDGIIDFTDRNQFLQYLNNRVNVIHDDKQKTDYLKMLSDLLRFKDENRVEKHELQRFYVPLTCHKCRLYLRELESLQEPKGINGE